jgi:hypothetical protein
MSDKSTSTASPDTRTPHTEKVSSPIPQFKDLEAGIAELETLEDQFRDAAWNNDASPRAIADFQTSILERYKRSKAIYIQRRVEQLVAQQIPTFDPCTNTFKHPEGPENVNDEDSDDDKELNNRREKALATLESTVQNINSKINYMRDSYQAVCSRRKELVKMVEDLKGNATTTSPGGKENINDEPTNATDEDIVREQKRLEELQKKKRQLQERLDVMRKEKSERENRLLSGRSELEKLKKEEAELLQSGKDMSYFHKKIEELKEMKDFYDNVRVILEELGGVKIVEVREDRDSQHLHLTLLMYEEYKVGVELEVFRQSSLRLFNARWISDPVVKAVSSRDRPDSFSMTMNPLDDLVQIAKTSMGPPHDVRFIIREVCARIRIMKHHVDDLALLRDRHGVLMTVDTNDRILCSFNDGIVIMLRLFDHWVRMEYIVGVNGWSDELTAKIRASVPPVDEKLKPTDVVNFVLHEIEKLKKSGEVNPSTPELPIRQGQNSTNSTSSLDVEMNDNLNT